LNEVRQELGLAPVRRPLHQWLHSPTRVIGLFPEWFAAPAADWPEQVRLTGFPLYDGPNAHRLAPDLVHFLFDQGDPPIVFTAGTAQSHGKEFFRAAVEACLRLRARGVLVSAATEQLPADTPPSVRAFAYAPFSELLPRAKAIVHHGGIGTAAQALKAGIAQVVVPLAYDQPDNAARLRQLGVASILSPRRLDGAHLARTLRGLLATPDLPAKLLETARRFEQASPIDDTCRLIEEAAAG